jgi:hypothetical protein
MDLVQWSVLAGVLSASAIVGKWVWELSDRCTTIEKAADEAKKAADSAGLRATTLCMRMDSLERALVEHRVSVAREYVSIDSFSGMKQELLQAIRNVNDRLDQMIIFQKNHTPK